MSVTLPRRERSEFDWLDRTLDGFDARAYGGGERGGPLASILLEIVASTVDDCLAAESGGADRIELCAAIATGGLTPSLGTLIEAKKRVGIPVMAMIRPRAGGFVYSESDFAVMRRDAAILLEHGADGIVFGILHFDGTVDTTRCGKMLEIAAGKQTVFHRAFDVVPDPTGALDQLIDLGFTRVLTSGQQKSALEGSELIARLIAGARRRIEVLPGGGIRAHNVRQLIDVTRCAQVHMTAHSTEVDLSAVDSPVSFDSIPDLAFPAHQRVDRETVQRVRETIDSISVKAE